MLAGGDPSVALVTVMHPTVLAWWLHTETEDQPAWEEQRAAVLSSAILGRQWGTIASEPGSGGDMLRTRTIAEPIAAEQGELPGRAPMSTARAGRRSAGYDLCRRVSSMAAGRAGFYESWNPTRTARQPPDMAR